MLLIFGLEPNTKHAVKCDAIVLFIIDHLFYFIFPSHL